MSVTIQGYCPSSSGMMRWSSVLVTPSDIEPITVEKLKALARLDPNDDSENEVLADCIAQARDQVENDTGTALLTQTRDVYLTSPPTVYQSFRIPFPPLQSLTSIIATAVDGSESTVSASQYVVSGNRLALGDLGAWPTNLRALQAWRLRIVVGYTSVALIPPGLIRAVGILATHYATAGRDLVSVSHILQTLPNGYEDAIRPYTPVVLA
jgi:uncharacterized phiE125 gp8 family phage protein